MSGIELRYTNPTTEDVRRAFVDSIEVWESIIQIDSALSITVRTGPIDGASGILAQATVTRLNQDRLPSNAHIEIDLADIEALDNDGLLDDTVAHEIGHALGFGSIFRLRGLIREFGGQPLFIGRHATARYSEMTGKVQSGVPLDTSYGHWNEAIFANELMTPNINDVANPLSDLTSAAMVDLGYTLAAAPTPVPKPESEAEPEASIDGLNVSFSETHIILSADKCMTITFGGDVRDGTTELHSDRPKRRKLTNEGNGFVTVNNVVFALP